MVKLADPPHLQRASPAKALRSLEIANHPDITDDAFLELLASCPHLETVEVKNCPLLGDLSLKSIVERSPRLSSFVWVGNHRATPEGYRAFSRQCPALSHLSFSGSPLPSSACRTLLSHTSLSVLDVSFCPIQDDAFAEIQAPLRFLNLQGCEHITDETLRYLAKSTTLQHLFLAFNNRLTRAGIDSLRSLSLQTLSISHCDLLRT